jgi:PAS domain S-box-containing protein
MTTDGSSVPFSGARRFLAFAGCALVAELLYLQYGGLSPALATQISELTQLALATLAAVACGLAAWRSAGAVRMFWGNLFLFAALWSVAQVLWTLATLAGQMGQILPRWDALFFVSAVPVVTALLCRPDRWANVRAGLFVDAALLTVAAFHIYAFFGVGHWLAGDQGGYADWVSRIYVAKSVLVMATAVWATATAKSARPMYASLTGALALLHFGTLVSDAALHAGRYHPGLYDLPWTMPFLWLAWLAVEGRFPRPLSNARPTIDWRESRLGAVLTVVLVLVAPLVHLGVVQIHGITPELTRLRVPLTLSTTLMVALLTILRQLGHLRGVESRVAAREAERDAAEASRRQVEERYRGLVQSVSAVVWRADSSTLRFTFVSDQAEALLGYPVAAWTAEPDFWLRHIHPEDRESAEKTCRAALAEGRSHEFRYRMVSALGDTVWVSDSVRVIPDLRGGTEAVGVMMDISERKRLEDERRQSQKMEAVGVLAGGIAHDFNNLLGVITGYAELAQRALEPGHRAHSRLGEVLRAAESAAGLTRQLLAFSRRQVVQPKLLDLKDVVQGLEPMLKRILGEDVLLVTRFAPDAVIVNADPGQVEQVVMNLAINARDAMPRGGRLTVRTARARLDEAFVRTHPGARAGAYVQLEVSDEGSGMDPATVARVFEPFFTTKEMGRGTGLGLSTVYGIVKQNDGYIDVESAPGAGSTFRVYLPEAKAHVERARGDVAPRVAAAAGGGETILVLEDEDGLRTIAREILEEAGYRVLEGRDVGEGMALASGSARSIDAILSDVVMPGVSGPEGVAQIRTLHPRIRVLYMSGYPDLDQRQGALGLEDELLEKPFTAEALLSRMRGVLDRA